MGIKRLDKGSKRTNKTLHTCTELKALIYQLHQLQGRLILQLSWHSVLFPSHSVLQFLGGSEDCDCVPSSLEVE